MNFLIYGHLLAFVAIILGIISRYLKKEAMKTRDFSGPEAKAQLLEDLNNRKRQERWASILLRLCEILGIVALISYLLEALV